MELFDTHAHFSADDDVDAIFARAAAAGVTRVLAVGGDDELNVHALRTPGYVALGFDREAGELRFATERDGVSARQGFTRIGGGRFAIGI